MKYKILKSIAHKFSHSFVRYMNYVDDGCVVDDLLQLARKANGERISIHWIPDSASQKGFNTPGSKEIAYHKRGFQNTSRTPVQALMQFVSSGLTSF